jgi:hypothetical protein
MPATALLAALLALTAADPEPKVLLIGIDGLRTGVLPHARTPNLDTLIAEGCHTDDAWTGVVTVSGPGWSSFFTGVWMDKHGCRDNAFEGTDYATYPHFFSRLKEARPDAVTVSILSWKPLDEHILAPVGADVRFFHEYSDDGDARSVDAAVDALTGHDPDAMVVYFADLDVAGHDHGFHAAVSEYIAELEEIDTQLGRILDAMRSRPSHPDEDWLVIVSTDHGGTIDGSHGRDIIEHRRIPLFVSGPSAARGTLHDTANQVDIPVTALVHLGVAIDPAWNLDGRPIGLRRERPLEVNLIHNGNAEQSTGGWVDIGSMETVDYGAPDGYPGLDTPGPSDRGRSFISGGAASESSIEQVIDIADHAALIDAEAINYEFGGWFGGFAEQRDLAWLTMRLLDERGGELARVTIGAVTLDDRRAAFGGSGDELTGLIERRATGRVPPGTRQVHLRLAAEAGEGANDGYADSLSLRLLRRP